MKHPVFLRATPQAWFVGLILWLVGHCGLSPALGQADSDVLQTLRRGHPRLLVLDDELAGIKKLIGQDAVARAWHERLKEDGRRMLKEAPVEHKLIGPRLLTQSRNALRRISTLAGLYRLDGDRAWAARARQEMLTAAAFPDWNPSHFLDTAEMTNALAIGYDWLHAFLSAEDKATIKRAIIDKGLWPGLKVYQKPKGWHMVTHNWNQVCNGGLTMGALALADEEAELARTIIDHGRRSIVRAMKSFAPDGGWDEGHGYWNYATHYNIFYLAAIQTALGTDFGLKKMPGLAQTGAFRMYSVGPLGLVFNFADGGDKAGTASQMFWLAREFQRPQFAFHERRLAAKNPDIFHLLWSMPLADAKRELLENAYFKGIDAAYLCSDWTDPQAVFVGFRGGDNKANHSHLDLGSFVLDAFGQRWALDLGGDNYNLPGYFGKQRWTYYRLRTEAHNTLTLDGANQNTTAKGPLLAFHAAPAKSFAVADLTAGYTPRLQQVRRGIALLKGSQVLIQDEWQASQPVKVIWNFHTKAKIATNGNRATLTLGKAQLEARILSPEGARFEVISANPPPPQGQQPDVANLIIPVPEKAGSVRLAVLLAAPGSAEGLPPLEPLEKWIAAGKLAK